MTGTSFNLRGYQGANPFHEAQAKSFAEPKLANEFYPISLYWSLFNEQHEILIGTRGSGKTALLRMLSYSSLRLFNDPRAEDARKRFIGFYIPLHLEFMASLHGKGIPDSERLEYFQFAFNCVATRSFLKEVQRLLEDRFIKLHEQRAAEGRLIRDLSNLWFSGEDRLFPSIADMQIAIDNLYFATPFWRDGSQAVAPRFSGALFGPLMPAFTLVAKLLELSHDTVSWLACIDEAEFLSEPFIQCINTFIRSEKKPVVVKLATLPFRHLTKATLTPGVFVQENGNDFNYRTVDLEWSSDDFVALTNHLCRRRLRKADAVESELEGFVGKQGNDDLIDYYRLEVPSEDSTDEAIIASIVDALSESRRQRFNTIKNVRERVNSDYFKRFAPVYYTRRMRQENSRGNRSVGWFAGAPMIRRVADGNPRRFIQLMNELFETARVSELTPKQQHRVLERFSAKCVSAIEALPEYGLLLSRIVETLGKTLQDRVHGKEMIDGGSFFEVEEGLLDQELFRQTIELGVAYSIIFVDENSLRAGLSKQSLFRLAHVIALVYWLPMRRGDRFVLRSKDATPLLAATDRAPSTPREAKRVATDLQLQLDLVNSHE